MEWCVRVGGHVVSGVVAVGDVVGVSASQGTLVVYTGTFTNSILVLTTLILG